MILSLTPNLMVRDVRVTADFFCQNLDFHLDAWVENEKNPEIHDFAMISFDRMVLMLQDAGSMQEEFPEMKGICIGQGASIFMKVLNVSEYYLKLKKKVTIHKEPYNTFYGTREFVIKDPNGYLLVFAQDTEEGGMPIPE